MAITLFSAPYGARTCPNLTMCFGFPYNKRIKQKSQYIKIPNKNRFLNYNTLSRSTTWI